MFGTKTIAIAASALAFAATGIQSVNAAPRDHGYSYGRQAEAGRIHFRIVRQKHRIKRGRRTGRLNWMEARRLRFELSHIRGFKSRYLRDGWLNWRESRHLNHLLNRNSRRIRRMATNNWGDWRPRFRRDDYRTVRQDRIRRDRIRDNRSGLNRYNGFSRY